LIKTCTNVGKNPCYTATQTYDVAWLDEYRIKWPYN